MINLVKGKGINFYKGIMGGYDIRGLALPKGDKKITLSPEIAFHIGAAIGSRMKEGETLFVTRDGRLTSPSFAEQLVSGTRQTGVNVVTTINPTPTGVASWYAINQKLDGSVVISGSHNPKEDNGFKIGLYGKALYGTALKELIPVMENGNYRVASKLGNLSFTDVVPQYIQMLDHAFPKLDLTGMRIVFDAGNGVGGCVVQFLKDKGAEVETRNIIPDGNFPAYGKADPSTAICTDALSKAVKEMNLNVRSGPKWFGLMTDGDADRSGFVTESGEVFWPEKMGAIFYEDYLTAYNNKKLPSFYGNFMALDVRGSSAVYDVVKRLKGNGFFVQAGYPSHRTWATLISKEIGKDKCTGRSAEASGHFFDPTAAIGADGKQYEHARYTLIDDGIYSAIILMKIAKEMKLDMNSLFKRVPDMPTSREIRIEVKDDSKKFELVAKLEADIKKKFASRLKPLGKGVMVLDGLRVQGPNDGLILVDGMRVQLKDDSWGVLRASNTSPMLTLKFEAKEAKTLTGLMQEFVDMLKAYSDQVDIKGLGEELSFQKNLHKV